MDLEDLGSLVYLVGHLGLEHLVHLDYLVGRLGQLDRLPLVLLFRQERGVLAPLFAIRLAKLLVDMLIFAP